MKLIGYFFIAIGIAYILYYFNMPLPNTSIVGCVIGLGFYLMEGGSR